MAIAFGATAHAEESISLGTTLSASINPSGSDKILLVGVGWNSDTRSSSADVTGVTFGGVALTRAIREQYTLFGTLYASVDIWYLIAPANGSASIVVTKGIEAQLTAFGAIVMTGVDQSSPIVSTGNSDGLGTMSSKSCSLTTETGQVIFDCMMLSDDGGAVPADTAGAGQTEITNNEVLSVFELGVATSRKAADAGSTTTSWSWVSSSIAAALAAVAIRPVSSAVSRSQVVN